MKVKVEAVDRFERDHSLRLPFRFGVITVTDATQAVIRVRISLPDGRTSHGVAAEALAANVSIMMLKAGLPLRFTTSAASASVLTKLQSGRASGSRQ